MRIGIVPDIHEPFAHPMALNFCLDTFDEWRIDHVHFAGDVVDGHALGFWDHDPNGHSASREQELALRNLERWVAAFPKSTVTIGNHDERHLRQARKSGIPDNYLKSFAEIMRTPQWDWRPDFIFDGVLYEHGTGSSGKDAALNRAIAKRKSLVMGHVHSYAGVKLHASDDDLIFGLNVGCLLNIDAYAFAYAKPFPVRPVLSCGIVIDGYAAYIEPMPCGPKDRYHKSRKPKRIHEPFSLR
jgi:predicted phosphodiesterase